MTPLKIPLFPPPAFDRKDLDLSALKDFAPQNWQYASSGKAALYQVLRSHQIQGSVALPVFACESMLRPIEALGLKAVFFDIDPQDLNPSTQSLKELLASDPTIGAVLFPSYYGLAADLPGAEAICKEFGVKLIDDGAQSLGTTLKGKAISCFGDGGLFSFSPGKATAGPMGAFYWSSSEHSVARSRHPFQHFLRWNLFKWQRLEKERWAAGAPLWKVIQKIAFKLEKLFPLWNDQMEAFERPILGGILHSLLSGKFDFRKDAFQSIAAQAIHWQGVRLVQAQRGESHPHKWVLIFAEQEQAQVFKAALQKAEISYGEGYSLLHKGNFPQATWVQGRLVELPLLADPSKQDQLLQTVHSLLAVRS